jgi:predicted AAA+ superfamily ATPase
MQYYRDITEKIRELAKHFPALVLTGARQTGKTTLLRGLFPNYSYVSLDVPADALQADEDPTSFLANYPPPVVIDEIQYAPKLFRHLKVAIDQGEKKAGQYILTGSQKFTLMKEVSESLAGRCAVLELETLSVNEIGSSFHSTLAEKGVTEVLCRGMYPGLWENQEMPKVDFYRSYLATYIERDVRQILNISSVRDFDRFMRISAARTGQLLNKADIAKEVGVSAKTINDWMSILVASNQIVLLEPYFENIGKRAVKSPKIYFTDVGLSSYLTGINAQNFQNSSLKGGLWETFVFGELRKSLYLTVPEASLWFYRDRSREADFLISYGGKKYLLDAKWKEIPDDRDFSVLSSIGMDLKETSPRNFVVCRAPHFHPVKPNMFAVNGFHLQEFIQAELGSSGRNP